MKTHPVHQFRYNPYLLKHYNVEPFHSTVNPLTRSFLAWVVNAFAKGLNDQRPPHLPRYLLIMLDKDLLQNLGIYDYGLSKTIEVMLKWLLININMMIEVRKQDLMKKKPGALSTSSEPRLIWVQMVKCPETTANKQIFSLSKKFNSILEEVISGDKRSHIMKIHIDTSENSSNFDRYGGITHTGLYSFWKIVDETMEEFDTGKTELAPKPRSAHSLQSSHMDTSQHSHGHRQHQRYQDSM